MAAWTGDDVALARSFGGHRGAVSCAVFLPRTSAITWDQLVSGGLDGTVKVHNFKQNLRSFEFSAHQGAVHTVAVSPGGELVASGGADRTVRLWRPKVQTGAGLALGGRSHAGCVRSAAFCAEGDMLVTAAHDKMVKLWDIPEARFRGTLSGHSNWVRAAAVHPSNKALIGSGGDDKTVKLWDAAVKRPYLTLYEHTAAVNSLAFSPDGLLIASASADSSVKLWDLRTGKLFQHYGPSVAGWWVTPQTQFAAVNSVAFHPAGEFLITASDDATLKLLDIPEGRVACTIQGHEGPALCASFSETGEMFCSGGADSAVAVSHGSLVRCGGDRHVRQRRRHRPRRPAVSISPRPTGLPAIDGGGRAPGGSLSGGGRGGRVRRVVIIMTDGYPSISCHQVWALSPEISPPVEPLARPAALIEDGAPFPGLKAAVAEIKTLKKPPMLVKAVMQAVCVLFGRCASCPAARSSCRRGREPARLPGAGAHGVRARPWPRLRNAHSRRAARAARAPW
jgi:WD40 repeat protein